MDNITRISNWFKMWFSGDTSENSFSKIKSALLSLVMAFILVSFFMIAEGNNPFSVIGNWIKVPIDDAHRNKIGISMATFVFLGLSIVVGLKIGVLNIGASSQFLMAGAVTVILGYDNNWNKFFSIPLLVFISFSVGTLIGMLTAYLKRIFNVSIFLTGFLFNWIVLYIVRHVISNTTSIIEGTTVNPNMTISDNFGIGILVFIISILVALIVFILYKYTTFGFEQKAIGFNKESAKYAGMNVGKNFVKSMGLSGGLAGIAGFLYYNVTLMTIPNLQHFPPLHGFEAISVAMLAYYSPIGIIPSAFFYGWISYGIDSQIGIGSTYERMGHIFTAFLFFTTSTINIWLHNNPYIWLKNKILLHKNKIWRIYKENYVKGKANHNEGYKRLISNSKESLSIKKAKYKKLRTDWIEKRSNLQQENNSGLITQEEYDDLLLKLDERFHQDVDNGNLLEYKKLVEEKRRKIKEIKKDFYTYTRTLLDEHYHELSELVVTTRQLIEKAKDAYLIKRASITNDFRKSKALNLDEYYDNDISPDVTKEHKMSMSSLRSNMNASIKSAKMSRESEILKYHIKFTEHKNNLFEKWRRGE